MSEGANKEKIDKHAFRWAVGIEGSCIPHLSINQYEWTQHERFWREDFRRAAQELGCKWMRYSLPWHLVEPQPGVFDWTWADERIHYARELGLEMMLDLVHFGVPKWLPDAFGDIDFPHAMERYTQAFARRYSGQVRSVCPVNEPLITAFFSGNAGLWPPHGRNLRTYMTLLARISQGLSRSMHVLRQSAPEMEIVLCDALEFPTIHAQAREVADERMIKRMEEDLMVRLHRRHIVIDLISGKVNEAHTLYKWLDQNGFSAIDMNWFQRNPATFDVLGLDYYPHSEMELYAAKDNVRQRVPETLAGFHKAAKDYWQRYQLPMMITETSCPGEDDKKVEWLSRTVEDIVKLRDEGVPIIGYTWWPLIDHLDWDGALTHQIGKIHHAGVYRLERRNGELVRTTTDFTNEYARMCKRAEVAVGKLHYRPVAKTAEGRIEATATYDAPVQLDFPIVVHCHLPWGGVWQRPQQFISRLSRTHRVLFVEGPILLDEDRAPYFRLQTAKDFPHVTIMQTFFPSARFNDGDWVDSERLRLLKEALNGPLLGKFENPVQWFYDPMCAPFAIQGIESSAIVYDCMDELSQFKFAPPELCNRERQLLEAADVVFVGGRKLHQSKSRYNSNAHFQGCGVDYGHFAKARHEKTQVPYDIDFIPRPILGYFGVIDERLDYDLIFKLADYNEDWSVVMIGPVAKVDPNELPARTNIYWLGRREYPHLPSYTKAFDVCLMPFALNEATEYINPTKALEYMATGKPIISSAVSDVVSNFGEVVKIARSHDEFIEHCASAVDSAGHFNLDLGLKMAEQNSWESIVLRLENEIRKVSRANKTPVRKILVESR